MFNSGEQIQATLINVYNNKRYINITFLVN